MSWQIRPTERWLTWTAFSQLTKINDTIDQNGIHVGTNLIRKCSPLSLCSRKERWDKCTLCPVLYFVFLWSDWGSYPSFKDLLHCYLNRGLALDLPFCFLCYLKPRLSFCLHEKSDGIRNGVSGFKVTKTIIVIITFCVFLMYDQNVRLYSTKAYKNLIC